MGRIKNDFLTAIIDKAILAVAALIALWILFAYVIKSPSAEYAGQKLSATNIDEAIHSKALMLEDRLKKKPEDVNEYQPKLPLYAAIVDKSIQNVNTNIIYPLPAYSKSSAIAADRKYTLPAVGAIAEAALAKVTMAAFVPTEELSSDYTYQQAMTKLTDVDLITVESSINIKQLEEKFQKAFNSKTLPEQWRFEQYATPVFAAVELQRREQDADGQWSDWADVPKTKICSLKKELTLPNADEYEIQIAMVQFANPVIKSELLQPDVYDNAIPAEPWICPSLYSKRQQRLEEELAEQKKAELEAEKAARLRDKATRTNTARNRTQTPARGGGAAGGMDMGMGMGMAGAGGGVQTAPVQTNTRTTRQQRQPQTTDRRSRRTEQNQQKQPELSELEQFKQLLIDDAEQRNSRSTTLPEENSDKLVFWAHDDTAAVGKKYQYRIRVGVFNPIAGKNWLTDAQQNLKDQAVLYSNFTEPTETVEIQKRLQIFATDIRETEKENIIDRTVEVKIARYTLGNWVTKVFSVKNGEQIGYAVDASETRLAEAGVVDDVDKIDFATGLTMLDCRKISQWTGSGILRQRDAYELICCNENSQKQAFIIRERYWPDDVSAMYKEIQQAEKTAPVALLTREQAKSGTGSRTNSINPATPGGIGGDMGFMPLGGDMGF